MMGNTKILLLTNMIFYQLYSKNKKSFSMRFMSATVKKGTTEGINEVVQILNEGKKETLLIRNDLIQALAHVKNLPYCNVKEWARQWDMSLHEVNAMPWSPNQIDHPHVVHIRQFIEDLPTILFKIHKSLQLSDIQYQALINYNLFEHYNRVDVENVSNNFEAIFQYYQTNFLAVSSLDYKKISNLTILKNCFVGSPTYLRYLQTQIKTHLIRSKHPNIRMIVRYYFTSYFFLTKFFDVTLFTALKKFYKDGKQWETLSSLPFPSLTYCDLPLDLAFYFARSNYRVITYEQDLTDLVFQLLELNNLLENPAYFQSSISINPLFTRYLKNKKKYLQQWSEDYLFPEEFFVFCLNSFLIGKNDKTFKPLEVVLKVEQENFKIRTPLFGTILLVLKEALLVLIHSFFYRQCYFLDNSALKTPNCFKPKDAKSLDQLFDLQRELFLKDYAFLNREVDDNILRNLGLYCYEEIVERYNFAFVLSVVEKQIQLAIFNTLITKFPELAIDKKNHYYDITLAGKTPAHFFIPKRSLDTVNLEELFLLLSRGVKDSTGYTISFKEIDLDKESKAIQHVLNQNNSKSENIVNKPAFDTFVEPVKVIPNVLNDEDNKAENIVNKPAFDTFVEPEKFFELFLKHVHRFTSSSNIYVEIDKGNEKNEHLSKLSFIELDVLIKTFIPTLSYAETYQLRKKITNVLKNRGFRLLQFTGKIDDIKIIWTKYFNKKLESKDSRVRGIGGLRLKGEVVNKLLKSL